MAPATKRALVASSSSDEYDSTTGVCSIEDFVASKDVFRAAPYGLIPTPFPFESGICTQKGANVAKTVEAQYMNVLDTYKITFSSIIFRSVWRKCFPSDAVDTLVVETLDIDYSKWREAASQILELFYTAGLQPGEIKVEISNPDKMYRDVSACVPEDQQLLGAIREVEPRVLEVVRKQLPGTWTSIAYHMRGPKNDTLRMKPTVMITCTPNSRDFFENAESLIAAVIVSQQYPQVSLHLELISASVELVTPPSPDQNPKPRSLLKLKDRPVNGASIGVQGKQMEAGTLGGWVTLRALSDPARTLKCAMTCYHVVEKGDLANRDKNDRNGVGLEGRDPLSSISIVWPSTFDLLETKRSVQTIIQSPRSTPKVKQQMTEYLDFLDKLQAANPIGSVKFASGHRRTIDDRRLDWALIESPSTFSRNKPPPSTAFGETPTFDKHPTYFTDGDEFISKFGTLKEGDWVAKAGRTSTSAGYVNQIRRRVNWNSNTLEDSYECEVMGFGNDFALGGDSGAMVVNDRFELVGLLIGAERQSSSFGSGFVTPIQAIRDDIKEMVGGEISLP